MRLYDSQGRLVTVVTPDFEFYGPDATFRIRNGKLYLRDKSNPDNWYEFYLMSDGGVRYTVTSDETTTF